MRRKDNINYLRLLEWEFVRNQRSSLDCVPLRQTDIQFKISGSLLWSENNVDTPTLVCPLFSGMNNYLCAALGPEK